MTSIRNMIAIASRLPNTHLASGLTRLELSVIEERFCFRFPTDLAELLSECLPIGPQWPEWRDSLDSATSDSLISLRDRLDWPLQGMLYDVEHNHCWDSTWGPRPSDLITALEKATLAIRQAPALIPVYAHRYLPAEPLENGNPVLSVYQTDIIVYGADLLRYFQVESGDRNESLRSGAKHIRCWTAWMNTAWTKQQCKD